MSAYPQPEVQGTVPASFGHAPPDLARLAELHDRSLLLDRCAETISRTAAGAMRLAMMRQRLLLSMRAAGLPESRWFRLGRFGLYLEPRPELVPCGPAPAYRLHTAAWATVRLAPALEAPEVTLGRTRRAGSLLTAYLSLSAHLLVRIRGGRRS